VNSAYLVGVFADAGLSGPEGGGVLGDGAVSYIEGFE